MGSGTEPGGEHPQDLVAGHLAARLIDEPKAIDVDDSELDVGPVRRVEQAADLGDA